MNVKPEDVNKQERNYSPAVGQSFMRYQRWLLGGFDNMVETYGFDIVDASGTIEEVFPRLRDRIQRIVESNGYVR